MQDMQQKIQRKQFRTVVSGYRLHGQLFLNQSQEQQFQLHIQSSSNKTIHYELLFNNENIQSYNLNESFPSPSQLYKHLSKMTKTKLKFNSQKHIFVILHQKQKITTQFPINLSQKLNNQLKSTSLKEINTQRQQNVPTSISIPTSIQEQNSQIIQQKEQIQYIKEAIQTICIQEPTQTLDQQVSTKSLIQEEFKQIHENKEIQEIKEENNSENKVHQSQNIGINQQDKVEQLRNYLGYNRTQNVNQNIMYQPKLVQYSFNKKQYQSLNLYQFSLKYQIQPLVNLIQNQQIHTTPQILLKRTKPILEIPPFNQISLDNLIHLSLQENKIEKIQNLESMPNLEKLNLQANNIKVIQNLTNLNNLKILKLGNNKILQIQGLQNLPNLETLWLDFNSIQKIEGLKSLTKLKSLNLSFNEISKIQGLDSLANLQELLLNENQLSEIESLGSLIKLTRLSLNSNFISQIKGLKKLLLLEVIYLTGNMIENFDKSAFNELNWLKMLKQLRLNGNQIQWNQQSTNFIQRLKNYGVKVKI